jgi:S1-C subfamily serine protease
MKVLALLLAVPLLVGAYLLTARDAPPPRAGRTYTSAQLENLMQGVYIAARPAVIQLQTLRVSASSEQTMSVERGRATGFFISADGYALTAYHAVAGQRRFQALTTRQELLNAEVVGFDESRDLALLKVSVPRAVEHLELEFARRLELGEALVEVGNADGDFMQPRYGTVEEFVQDAGNLVPTELVYSTVNLNPGDSGGAVLDFHGRAVAVGIGFAQSATRRVALLVPLYGLETRVAALKRGLRAHLPGVGLHVVHNPSGGVLIDRVEPGSSAAEQGIAGGVVTAVDGKRIGWQSDYYSAIRAKGVGERVTLEVKVKDAVQRYTLELR